MKDFFVSYNRADKTWAEWIAYTLEESGYSVVIQAWDFRPGGNFVLEMQKAATETERTVVVLSENYLKAEYTQPEWAAAFARDPRGQQRTLVPFRVEECSPAGIMGQIIYVDLVGLIDRDAKAAVLGAFAGRAKPPQAPAFPGPGIQPTPGRVVPERVQYPGKPWNVPVCRNPFFTGREKVLQKLEDALKSTGAAALSGLGGIGKTQTAAEYAYRHRDEYQAVLWASAASRETLISDFAALAALLNLPLSKEKEQEVAVAAAKRWFEANSGWLLVLDNADDLAMAREFIPHGTQGHILLTTRAQATAAVAERVEIEEMEPGEGALFLLRRAGVLAKDTPLSAATAADRKLAGQISGELGQLPLALDQAGAFIEETPSTLAEYIEFYKSEGAKLRAERGGLGDHPSVAVTFSLAFKKVAEASAASADLIRLCAFLAPDAIPEEIFTEGAAELGENLATVPVSPLAFAQALKEAGRYSLIERHPENRVLDIHRLVQAVLQDGMDAARQREWSERAVRAVNEAFPGVEFSNWPQCERFLPHAQACVGPIENWAFGFEEAARLLNQTGLYLSARARYVDSEPLLKRALEIYEKARGPHHPDVATSLNNLAALYDTQGRYAEAEPLYQRALEILEKALRPDHPDLAQSLNNLAVLYDSQGKYAEAKPLFQRALEIREKALGPDHPDVATTLSNLAGLYYDQGQYGDAEPLFRRALEICEKALGPDHPNVATVLENYADLLRKTNRKAQADELAARAQVIRAKQAKQ